MQHGNVTQVFKAFWTQANGEIPGSNNPFGEILRFVVLRPHKRHSICLYMNTSLNWYYLKSNYVLGLYTHIRIRELQPDTPRLGTTWLFTLEIGRHPWFLARTK
jgi:hypothetical protein